MESTGVAIVGAGPIGLAVAAELKRRGRDILVFDRGPIGRTISWYPLGMRFNSSAANLELLRMPVPAAQGDKPTREEYLAYLRDFVKYHELNINTYEEVRNVEPQPDGFKLINKKRAGVIREYHSRQVVLAIGSNEFPRRLGIPGEDLPRVSHYFHDPHEYHGQRVVIVGGRNSAAEAAIRLTHLGAKVTLIHRRPEIDVKHLKYWIGPELLGMIAKNRIRALLGSTVTHIDDEHVYSRDHTGHQTATYYDAVLLLVGYVPDYTLIDQLGIDTHKEQREPVINPNTLETNVRGVYCAGTIVAGDQNPYRVFIENALHHPKVIADALDAVDPIRN